MHTYMSQKLQYLHPRLFPVSWDLRFGKDRIHVVWLRKLQVLELMTIMKGAFQYFILLRVLQTKVHFVLIVPTSIFHAPWTRVALLHNCSDCSTLMLVLVGMPSIGNTCTYLHIIITSLIISLSLFMYVYLCPYIHTYSYIYIYTYIYIYISTIIRI